MNTFLISLLISALLVSVVSCGRTELSFKNGTRIAIEMSSATLSDGAAFTVFDGNTWNFKRYVFHAGRGLFALEGRREVPTSFPLYFLSDTNVLIVHTLNFADDDIVSIRYEAYNPNTGCVKSEIKGKIIKCNTMPIALRADYCDISLSCGEHREQSGPIVGCVLGSWSHNVTCDPIPRIMDTCSITGDVEISSGCPYTFEEIADHYMKRGSTQATLTPSDCRTYCWRSRPRSSLEFGKWLKCIRVWTMCGGSRR